MSPLDRLDDNTVSGRRKGGRGGKSGVNIVKLQIVMINQLFDPKFRRGKIFRPKTKTIISRLVDSLSF